MRFVHHEQEILREKIEEREGLRARRPAGEMPRVILDPVAEAHLLHHLEIVFRAHLQALRLEQFAVLLEPDDALVQLLPDRVDARAASCRAGVTNCFAG